MSRSVGKFLVFALVTALFVPLAAAGIPGLGVDLHEVVPASDLAGSNRQDRPDGPLLPPEGSVGLGSETWDEPAALPIRLRDDLVALAAAPLEWDGADWRKLGLGVAVVAAVSLIDEEVNDLIDDDRPPSVVRTAEAFRPLGQDAGLALLGASWLAGRGLHRPELVAVAEDGLEATLIAAGVITPALKALFARTRPRNTDHGSAFWGADESFPSGEATQAFAIASVVAAHSDRTWVKATAWSLAGAVGLSRMELDGHWASDVVAGALIGSAVGRWVVRRNRPELDGRPRLAVTPTLGEDSWGVAVAVRF